MIRVELWGKAKKRCGENCGPGVACHSERKKTAAATPAIKAMVAAHNAAFVSSSIAMIPIPLLIFTLGSMLVSAPASMALFLLSVPGWRVLLASLRQLQAYATTPPSAVFNSNSE